MNAKRLKSGNFRAKAYDYTDEEGKKHYRSFTAPTKREAERMAHEFLHNRDRSRQSDLTVAEAIEGYITAKQNILSPSTIKGYRAVQRNQFSRINSRPIKYLTTPELQTFVSHLTENNTSKTVHNVYGLLSASLSFYMPDVIFRVTLPRIVKKRQSAPSDDDVRALFNAAGEKLKKCIALAAFGSLRRGEICAVKFRDIESNIIYIHADMVQAPDKSWVYKDSPKTSESVRYVKVPQKVIEMLGTGDPDDYVIDLYPNNISDSFLRLKKKLGIEGIRFHDLRHYFASIGVALSIPDTYLSDFGGWRRGSTVLKSVYQNSIKPLSDMYSDKMVEHFDDIIGKSMPQNMPHKK